MNSRNTRSTGQTRTSLTSASTATRRASSSSSTKAVPKIFTASSPKASTTKTTEVKTFTNRVHRRSYRPPAPPKFLQKSSDMVGQAQVKPTEEEDPTDMKANEPVFNSSTTSIRRKSRTELKPTRPAEEEDLAITASESEEHLDDHIDEPSQEKEKPNVRRHDPLVYRSENCTFNQDYLSLLTFDHKVEDLTLSDAEEEQKNETPKVAPRARTFKPYVKKEQNTGFGFWSSGLEDSLLTGSGFSYKPSVAKNPLPKRTQEGEKKNVLPPTLTSTSAFSSSPMFF